MKKITLLAAVALMAGSLFTACGGSKAKQPQYNVELKEAFTCGSYDGSEVLVLNLDATNNTEEYIDDYTVAYGIVATIDGKTLKDAYLMDDNPFAIPSGAKIAGGATQEIQKAFELDGVDYDENTEIQLVATAYTIKNYEQVTILEQTVKMADVEKKVSESEYNVKVDNVTVTDDGEGHNLVVIDYTFTNDSDEAMSFGSAIRAQLFQDGVELQSGYLPYNHPLREDIDSDNTYTEIKSGASIQVRSVYTLTSTSNVEIKLVDQKSFDKAEVLNTEIKVDVPAATSDDEAEGSEDISEEDSESDSL